MKKIMHLASFNGNIGDVANHRGFWNLFDKYVTKNYEKTTIEIRDFYQSWNDRVFDKSFVEYINTFDAMVIGGGNFFDVKWEYSETGTTVNIHPGLFEQIRIPVVFNGMGVECVREENNDIIDKFVLYINYLYSKKEQVIISVRNDGSKEILEKLLGNRSYNRVFEIPDGGFFTTANSYFHPEINDDGLLISVNLAKDRPIERFCSEYGYNSFCKEFGEFINKAVDSFCDIHFVFTSHIPSDISIISDVLSNVNDKYCRKNVSIAPYLNGTITPGDYIVDLYRKSNIVIAMRYHSNICSIAMNTPAIAAVSLPKHIKLHEKIGLENRLIDIQAKDFSERLLQRVKDSISNTMIIRKENTALLYRLELQSKTYYEAIRGAIM